jgi:hypothetical protein
MICLFQFYQQRFINQEIAARKHSQTFFRQINPEQKTNMAKSQNAKKQVKKAPAKTPVQKKAVKAAKKKV